MPRNRHQEWVGAHDNAAIPEQVKRRILQGQFNADGVPVCPDCGNVIRPSDKIEFDHAQPLEDGGKHAESNLRAIHKKPCHTIKTAAEATKRADERSQFNSVYGLKTPKHPLKSRNTFRPYQPNVRELYGDLEETE